MNFGRSMLCAAVFVAATAGESGAVTFQNVDAYRSQLAAPIYTGVGRLVTATAPHVCTASLVSRNVVLTAAHCLTGDATTRFALAATGAPGSTAVDYGIRSTFALPSSTGTGISDMALITLDRNVYGRDIYELYAGTDEIGQVFTAVGGGFSGLLSEGFSFAYSDFQTRYGVNRYEVDATVFGYGNDILMFDNDNGLAENDVFGRYLNIHDTGVRVGGELVEVGLIYGDSGGPDFIGGKLSGVHSFAGSGSYFETPQGNICGVPGAVDPVAPNAIYDTCTDGSAGDFAGSVRVSFYRSSIDSYIAAAAVPEPATWAMMVAGFGAIGGVMRRRRARRPALA